MKKSVVIIILLIYCVSIVVVNFFGLKMHVYNEFVSVDSIICINEDDDNVDVNMDNEKTILKTKFTKAYDKNIQSGTMIQIYWRVLPDNATIKNVKFVYDEKNTRVEFYKTENGEYTGLVLFYNKSMIDVKIMSTDGRRIYKELTLWAY